MEAPLDGDLVVAAQDGDGRALEELIRRYLPLVYNVVGRALNGHADVDDVVQETMLRVTQRLGALREPDNFRPWLFAICFRQIHTRGRVRSRGLSRERSLEVSEEQLPPEHDFADLAVLQLGLSGQRREVMRASRWLSGPDRQILALWWQEAAGQLSRAELVEAAGLKAGAAAVRIQRMKDRLNTARIVERVLDTGSGCPTLLSMLGAGRTPGERELNRLSRHVRRCPVCAETGRSMLRPESLLAAIALVPIPRDLLHGVLAGVVDASHSSAASLFSPAAAQAAGASALTSKPALATGALLSASGLAMAFAIQYLPPSRPVGPSPGPTPSASAPAAAVPAPAADPRPARQDPTAVYGAYAMAYFTETPRGRGNDYGLHLAVSSDGLNWMPLHGNAPVLTPAGGTGGLRDPFVLRKPDGTFVVLATDAKGQDVSRPNQYIHTWQSPDLRTFTYHRLRVHRLDTHAWAPEAFYDPAGARYGIVYSANRGGLESLFVSYTTDFRTAGEPQPFFNPGYDVLDPTILNDQGLFRLFFRDGRTRRIAEARSTVLQPGSFDRAVVPRGWPQGDFMSGPLVVKEIGGPRRWLWQDAYAPDNGRLYAWQNAGDGLAWAPLPERAYAQPPNAKQGSVVPITAAEREDLVQRWGAPARNRIRSYNFPDRLLRHQNGVARIDPYPFDPFEDSEWRIVPGLADPALVSFRSVNYPERYLRESRDEVVLAQDDGTPEFRAAATFERAPGLADPAGTSFRSTTRPDRYLRHFHYVLRVDPVRDQTDRQDATFIIGY